MSESSMRTYHRDGSDTGTAVHSGNWENCRKRWNSSADVAFFNAGLSVA